MKLLWFPEKISSDIKCDSVKLPTCRLAAETAVVRHGTPLFLPGWSNEWNGFVGIGVAIERLGRHIDERFAHRYYSQTVVAVKALPAGMSMDGAERCSDAMFSLDGSIVVSSRIEMIDAALVCRSMDLHVSDADMMRRFDLAVSAASRAFTLHTGDMVIAGVCGEMPLVADTRFKISSGETVVISNKIK
jgi:hypothetical protein